MTKYNKLVRDRIPEIIKKKGGKSKIHIANDNEYWVKLKNKLSEEVDELIKSENEEEFVDVLEVLDAMFEYLGLKKKYIEFIKQKKAKERGQFKKRIILDES